MKIQIHMSTFAVDFDDIPEAVYDSICTAVTHGHPYKVEGIYFAPGKTQCIAIIKESNK